MKRNLTKLSNQEFDCVIIGGGIAGVTFAREMAARGASVALIEQDDVASGTTSRSTRLIHGGLRYLELFDFALVREDLKERELLFKNAPHLVQPLLFMTPVYDDSPRSYGIVKCGMILYDVLSFDKSVSNHQSVNAKEAVRQEPNLSPKGLKGALLYYDGQCVYPERLALANIQDAASNGAVFANYCKVVGLEREAGKIKAVKVIDELSGQEITVRCKLLVNAAGPWVDRLAPELGIDTQPRLRLTKGVHVVVPKFTDHAIVLMAAGERRIFFVIPWNGYSLVGTTDTDYEGDPADVRCDADDIEYLRRETKRTFPNVDLGDIKAVTAGLRPLVRASGAKGASQTSRKHAVIEHAGVNAISILGVKITNARWTAVEAAEKACHFLGREFGGDITKQQALAGGNLGTTLAEYIETAYVKHGQGIGLSRDAVSTLVRYYGTGWEQLLPIMKAEPELIKPLADGFPELAVQARWAVKEEMAQSVSDVLLRRIPMALSGEVPQSAVEKVASELAREYGWDAATKAKAIAEYDKDADVFRTPAEK